MSFVRAAVLAISLALLAPSLRAQPARVEGPAAVVVPPKLVSEPVVAYPEGASGDARVVLVIVVNPEGGVESATPETGEEPFASSAAAAALSFRFTPATRDGVSIPARIRFEVVFREPVPEPAVEAAPAPPSAPAKGEAPAPAPAPPEPIDLDVLGERPEPSRSASLSRAEVRELPGAFGDPFRAIEALPGVTPIVSGLPFFFVRGAPPGNAGYFLDGVRVPLLFHVGIGPSVVHPGLIDRVDLYPGGYPARFGRFAGGIIAGETAPPKTELHGEYNVRLFDAGALAEAPFADQRGKVLLGGRYSYTAALLSVFAPETVLHYWDYQGRVSYDLSADDTVSAFSFGSYDYLGQKTQRETITLFSTEFHRLDLRYDRRLGADGKLRLALTGGFDRSQAQVNRFVTDRVIGGRMELEYKLGPAALLRAGADVQTDTYDIDLGPTNYSPQAAQVAALFPARTDLALGTRADVVIDVDRALAVTPGLRVDLYSSAGAAVLAFDPRLGLRARAAEGVHLLAAYGVAHQPPAFVVPVPGIQPGGLAGGLQRALQESFGVETKLDWDLTLTTTVFHNAFFHMTDPLGSREAEVDGCAPGEFPEDSIAGDRGGPVQNASDCGDRFPPGTLGPDRSGGGGQAAGGQTASRAQEAFEVRSMGASYGLEILLKRDLTRDLGGFVAYTLSRSVRSYADRSYIAAFDRTHVFNGAVAYNLGRRWRAGTRVMFYTGLPKPPDPSDSSTRLPPFFRVDLRLEKRWQLTDTAWISGVAEWMNATLSKEAIQTTCTLSGCEAQTIGPVTIPSLGVEGGF